MIPSREAIVPGVKLRSREQLRVDAESTEQRERFLQRHFRSASGTRLNDAQPLSQILALPILITEAGRRLSCFTRGAPLGDGGVLFLTLAPSPPSLVSGAVADSR